MKTLPSILKKIIQHKSQRLEISKGHTPLNELTRKTKDLPATKNLLEAVRGHSDVHIIAEMKRRSPSRGEIQSPYDIPLLQRAYEKGGGDAFSILTEEDFFGGSLDHLRQLRLLTEKPLPFWYHLAQAR